MRYVVLKRQVDADEAALNLSGAERWSGKKLLAWLSRGSEQWKQVWSDLWTRRTVEQAVIETLPEGAEEGMVAPVLMVVDDPDGLKMVELARLSKRVVWGSVSAFVVGDVAYVEEDAYWAMFDQ